MGLIGVIPICYIIVFNSKKYKKNRSMKKIYYLLGLILLFTACGKDLAPVVITGEPESTNIEANSAVLTGTIVDNYNNEITEVGVMYGTAADALTNTCVGTLKNDHISASLTNLEPGKIYYYYAYATSSVGTGKGLTKWFTTGSSIPTVKIIDLSDNCTPTTITVKGKIENFNGDAVRTWGFECVSKETGITYTLTNPAYNYDDNTFTGTFTGLTASTKYDVTAFAVNGRGRAVSNTLTYATTSFLSDFMDSFVSANGLKVSSIEVTAAVLKEVEGLTPTADDMYPATNMSYATIISFISKLNAATGRAFRLPTLAEWQALANDGHTFSGSNNIGEVAWYLGNCGSAQMGGKLKGNDKGLFDMSGNVWEMTATAGNDNKSHYICGGSFRSHEDQCVVTSKVAYPDGQGSDEIGFRLVE